MGNRREGWRCAIWVEVDGVDAIEPVEVAQATDVRAVQGDGALVDDCAQFGWYRLLCRLRLGWGRRGAGL